jgi:hypothetical protein
MHLLAGLAWPTLLLLPNHLPCSCVLSLPINLDRWLYLRAAADMLLPHIHRLSVVMLSVSLAGHLR